MRTLPDGLAVAVTVPASTANLGPGFDSIGMALGVWDEYEVVVGGDGLVVEVEGEGAHQVPRDARHLVHRCLAGSLAEDGVALPAGLTLRCRNRVPHSRGMGSSATAAVAGHALAGALLAASGDAAALDLDLDVVNERAARTEGHPDNSSASVYGGMTLSWAEEDGRARTVRLAVHEDVVPIVAVPDIELSTAAARAALPLSVPLRDAARTAGRAALLVEALTRRPELLVPATREWLHQEPRRIAYPATMRVVDALRARGLAAAVSGAGPTVLVLATRAGEADARAAVDAVTGADPVSWRVLTPGVPARGVQARRLA